MGLFALRKTDRLQFARFQACCRFRCIRFARLPVMYRFRKHNRLSLAAAKDQSALYMGRARLRFFRALHLVKHRLCF
jgi:hypothetical protein